MLGPNIIGQTGNFVRNTDITDTGALSKTTQQIEEGGINTAGLGFFIGSVILNASNANSIYSSSSTVQPKSIICQYLIRY